MACFWMIPYLSYLQLEPDENHSRTRSPSYAPHPILRYFASAIRIAHGYRDPSPSQKAILISVTVGRSPRIKVRDILETSSTPIAERIDLTSHLRTRHVPAGISESTQISIYSNISFVSVTRHFGPLHYQTRLCTDWIGQAHKCIYKRLLGALRFILFFYFLCSIYHTA